MKRLSPATARRGRATLAMMASLALGAGMSGLAPDALWAQQPAAAAPDLLPWPEPSRPAAATEPAPKAARKPKASRQVEPAAETPGDAPATAASTPPRRRPAKPRKATGAAATPPASADAIRCDGPWAKDSTHEKVAEALGAENVVFTQVDGPEGTKLNATVAFPNDPKRRVEIVWHDEAARARPSSIIVGGESAWSGPRSVRIGAALADVEKQNGKPFKLSGFDWDYGGTAGDWQNGALAKLSGDCTLGVRFAPDPGAPAAARSKVSGEGEFLSNSPAMRAVKPRVQEFFVGYPE